MTREEAKTQLGGTAELAARFAVHTSTIRRWRARPDFPAPIAVLRAGALYDLRRVEEWAASSPT